METSKNSAASQQELPHPLPNLGRPLEALEVADLIAATPNPTPDLAQLVTAVRDGLVEPDAAFGQLIEATRDAVVASGMSFLDRMHRPDEMIELRGLDPEGRPEEARIEFGRLGLAEERARLASFIADQSGQRNIYFSINPRLHRGGRAKDVAARRNVVLDLDFVSDDAPSTDMDRSATLSALRGLNPSALVASGGGYHAWFPVEELLGTQPLFLSAAVLGPAMKAVHSDNMADPARIIRLPGTLNIPSAGKRAKGRRLAWSELLETADTAPVRSADKLAEELVDLAKRVGLPNATRPILAGAATKAGEKTPSPAPSGALLRLALSHMPNHSGGPFDSRDAWQALGHAIKGAAMAGGIESEAREMWLDWCALWGGSSDKAERFWDTCLAPHIGWGTVLGHLRQHNPQGYDSVEAAERAAALAAIMATPIDPAQRHLVPVSSPTSPAGAPLSLVAVQPPQAQAIPPRRWYYERNIMGGFLTLIVAPGGTGKSALMMGEAVAMATGQNLLGVAPVRPLKVWLHNAEDDHTEALRRLTATLMAHGLRWPDLNGNIILTSGRDLDLMLAVQTRDGGVVRRSVVERIVAEVKAASVDVIVFDPLGAMHTLNENSNEAANMLMGAFREIAHRTGAGVVLVHHTSKAAALDMGNAGVGASRGASAFTDAARIVRQLARMTTEEAKWFAIAPDQRWRFFRVDNGKSNMAPAGEAKWFELASVSLNNGAGLWPRGDEVGVVRAWTPPGPVTGTKGQLIQVQQALTGIPPAQARASETSPGWVGHLVADALGWDIGAAGSTAHDRTGDQQAARAKVKSLIASWLRDGSLRTTDWRNPKEGKLQPVIAVGEVALPFDEGTNEEAA